MFKTIKAIHTINKHRFVVFKLCCKCGIVWRGLVHDLTKFSWQEIRENVKFYNGKFSPLAKCRQETGRSLAWLHHKGRNKHHLEYWLDRENEDNTLVPYKYAVECICDKIAAGKTYKKKDWNCTLPLEYWNRKDGTLPMNAKTHAFISKVFSDLAEHGEKFILNKRYMKKTYKQICEN